MDDDAAILPVPSPDLDPPGTYLYTGPLSSRGFALNRFALSLRDEHARREFLGDEPAYVRRFGLGRDVEELIARRDWTGLLAAGGHLQALLKLAATLGMDLFDIGAHNAGVDRSTMFVACPRRVTGLGSLGG